MRSMDEFKRFSEETILPELKPLELRRKAALRKIVLFVVVLIVGMMITIVVIGSHGAPGPVIFGTLVAFLASIAAGIRLMRFDLAEAFKHIAVAKIVTFLDAGLAYDPKMNIPSDAFARSRIFPDKFRSYRGGDLVTGNAGGMQFSFSYLLVRRTRSGGRRHNAPIFQGLFLAAHSGRTLRGTTVVRPNQTSGRAVSFIQKKLRSLFGSDGEEVDFEDPVFTERYTVHSTEPGEARTVLTLELRRQILERGQGAAKGLSLSFTGQNVYAALNFDMELFGAHMTRSVLHLPGLEADFEALRAAVALAGTLRSTP